MFLSMNWISDFVDFTGLDKLKLISQFSLSTAEVENEIFFKGSDIDGIVVAEIKEVNDHPDSKKLHLLKVDAGNGELTDVVCGAPNVRVGMKTAFAPVGARIGEITIAPRPLAGFTSYGMCCSEKEIGISDNNDGIMDITDDLANGTLIKDAYEVDDIIFEVDNKSLTNRPDLWGHYGIAREFAAIAGRELKPIDSVDLTKYNNLPAIDMKIEDPLCQRYSCLQVENITKNVSPVNMRIRLFYCGMRSINLLADLTNYLMLELGQPMHAFDARQIRSGKIVVERAKEDEVFVTLDEIERKLDSSFLCIKDNETSIGLAGIMGGLNSEIQEDTTEVIFESANFDGTNIRVNSKKLNLRSESSARFEKDIDPNLTALAIDRACALVCELNCGEVIEGTIDIYNSVKEEGNIVVDSKWINTFLGTEISKEDMKKYLDSLELKTEINEDNLEITIPTFRIDIAIKEDIAEEVARIYGYDKIPTTIYSASTGREPKYKNEVLRDLIVDTMVSSGLNQSISYSFISPKVFDKINIAEDSELRNVIKIKNPLGEDYSVMRTTTIHSMMECLGRNYSRNNDYARLFEIGKVYIPQEDETELPIEKNILTIGMYGNCDYLDLKGIVENILHSIGLSKVMFTRESDNLSYHPGKTAALMIGNKKVGVLGEVHPDVSENYGVDTNCYLAELNLDMLFEYSKTDKKYKALPKYPAVTRDIALLVNDEVLVQEIEETIRKAGGNLVEKVELFDIYKGAQIPEGKKSIAYAIAYRDDKKTLTDNDVNKVHDKILRSLEYKLGATLR